MKKINLLSFLAFGIVACGGATEEQNKAATEFCECMEKAEFGDFDIDYIECYESVKKNNNGVVLDDENYLKALEEKCPDIASKIK